MIYNRIHVYIDGNRVPAGARCLLGDSIAELKCMVSNGMRPLPIKEPKGDVPFEYEGSNRKYPFAYYDPDYVDVVFQVKFFQPERIIFSLSQLPPGEVVGWMADTVIRLKEKVLSGLAPGVIEPAAEEELAYPFSPKDHSTFFRLAYLAPTAKWFDIRRVYITWKPWMQGKKGYLSDSMYKLREQFYSSEVDPRIIYKSGCESFPFRSEDGTQNRLFAYIVEED